jgi:hypothetical protein
MVCILIVVIICVQAHANVVVPTGASIRILMIDADRVSVPLCDEARFEVQLAETIIWSPPIWLVKVFLE